MRILFIGCVESSYILLNELINQGADICAVITKEKSRLNADFTDLTRLCIRYNIEYFFTDDSRDEKTLNFIKKMNPDIIYCFGWSYLLSKEVICIPKLGVVGFHPAKLPYNKGRHPVIWALVLGLESTASSFFMIDEKADSGDIISQVDVQINFEDDARILYDKIMAVAKYQVVEITRLFSKGSITYTSQKNNDGNVWRKRNKSDGRIDFRMSSKSIYNLVRGLTKPYIGAHFEYSGSEYKVWETEIVPDEYGLYGNIEPGKVIVVYSFTSFLIKTGDGLIKITNSDEIKLKEGDYI